MRQSERGSDFSLPCPLSPLSLSREGREKMEGEGKEGNRMEGMMYGIAKINGSGNARWKTIKAMR